MAAATRPGHARARTEAARRAARRAPGHFEWAVRAPSGEQAMMSQSAIVEAGIEYGESRVCALAIAAIGSRDRGDR
jgi:hypothetical protein